MAKRFGSPLGLSSETFLAQIASQRPRVNFFTSLPPAPTKIAAPVIDVVRELKNYCDIVLWTSQEKWEILGDYSIEVEKVHPHSIPWSRIHAADLNIYNLSALSDYHASIWEVSRICPGIVVMHEENFQEFFAEYYLARLRDGDGYANLMKEHHGLAGLEAAHQVMRSERSVDQVALNFSLVGAVARGALAVVKIDRSFESQGPVPSTNEAAQADCPFFEVPPFDQAPGAAARVIAQIACAHPYLRESKRIAEETQVLVDSLKFWGESPEVVVGLFDRVIFY